MDFPILNSLLSQIDEILNQFPSKQADQLFLLNNIIDTSVEFIYSKEYWSDPSKCVVYFKTEFDNLYRPINIEEIENQTTSSDSHSAKNTGSDLVSFIKDTICEYIDYYDRFISDETPDFILYKDNLSSYRSRKRLKGLERNYSQYLDEAISLKIIDLSFKYESYKDLVIKRKYFSKNSILFRTKPFLLDFTNLCIAKIENFNSIRSYSITYRNETGENKNTEIPECFREVIAVSRDLYLEKPIRDRYLSDLSSKDLSFETSYVELLLLIRYYKETTADIDGLNRIESFLKSKRDLAKEARHLTSYLLNNKLSFWVSTKEPLDLFKIKTLFYEITSQYNNYSMYNYFPYLKYLKALKINIDNELSKTNANTIVIEEFLTEFKNVLKEGKNNIVKMIDNQYYCDYEFILPINESKVIHNSKEFYLLSLYYVPRDVAIVNNELEQFSNYFNNIENTKNIFNSIQNKMEASLAQIDDKAKSADKRSIEIITLFSAIVMFVAGDIQLLKGVENIKIAINLMLVFGFTLSVFVGLIIILIRSSETPLIKRCKSFHFKHFYVWYLILGFLTILFFNYFDTLLLILFRIKNIF